MHLKDVIKTNTILTLNEFSWKNTYFNKQCKTRHHRLCL